MKRRRNQEFDKTVTTKASAWEDVDDDVEITAVKYTPRLEKIKTKTSSSSEGKLNEKLMDRYQLGKELSWTNTEAVAQDDSILQHTGSLIENISDSDKWKYSLEAGKIDIIREADLNVSDPSSDTITFIKFNHHDHNMAMVGSADKYLKLFQVDGNRNNKILRVKIHDFSLSSGDFLANGSVDTTQSPKEVILCGRRPHFLSYDITTGSFSKFYVSPASKTKFYDKVVVSREGSYFALPGDNGYTHIMDSKHKTWVCDLKMNATSKTVEFLDNHTIITADAEAEVYIWDIRNSGKCVHKFSHDDGTATRSLGVHVDHAIQGQGDRSMSYKVAVGAESGIVSVYDGEKARSSYTHNKIKSYMSLRTSATQAVFHPSGDILAIASSEMKDQMKLVHVPTGTVFTNWPSDRTPLNVVSAVEFSPGGAYLAIGNKRGNVLLYRLKQYMEA